MYSMDPLDIRDDSHPGREGMGLYEISTCFSEWIAIENLWIIYFWNFPFSIFGSQLTSGNRNCRWCVCVWGYCNKKCLRNNLEHKGDNTSSSSKNICVLIFFSYFFEVISNENNSLIVTKILFLTKPWSGTAEPSPQLGPDFWTSVFIFAWRSFSKNSM